MLAHAARGGLSPKPACIQNTKTAPKISQKASMSAWSVSLCGTFTGRGRRTVRALGGAACQNTQKGSRSRPTTAAGVQIKVLSSS